jgi:hypothetical protein
MSGEMAEMAQLDPLNDIEEVHFQAHWQDRQAV